MVNTLINVLVLTRYVSNGASSRLRTFQYLSRLESDGFRFHVHALLDEDYLDALYSGQRIPLFRVVRSYLKRIGLLIGSGRYDAVWLEKEALPWFPAAFEKFSAPLLVDYDDAIFHRYDDHRSPLVRALLRNKIDSLMARASVVVVGNRYLGQHAELAGARRVVQVPTCVDVDKYRPAVASDESVFTVGWIGTPHTAKFLSAVCEPLRRLASSGRVAFRFIGAPAGLELGFEYTPVSWSEDTEAAELQKLDCGIMPLPDQPFERGKSGYKLIQYMACSLPVVASPVGANCDIVVDGSTGFLAADDAQWFEALSALMSDSAMRRSLGGAGRRRVEERYDRNRSAAILADLLRGLKR